MRSGVLRHIVAPSVSSHPFGKNSDRRGKTGLQGAFSVQGLHCGELKPFNHVSLQKPPNALCFGHS